MAIAMAIVMVIVAKNRRGKNMYILFLLCGSISYVKSCDKALQQMLLWDAKVIQGFLIKHHSVIHLFHSDPKKFRTAYMYVMWNFSTTRLQVSHPPTL